MSYKWEENNCCKKIYHILTIIMREIDPERLEFKDAGAYKITKLRSFFKTTNTDFNQSRALANIFIGFMILNTKKLEENCSYDAAYIDAIEIFSNKNNTLSMLAEKVDKNFYFDDE